MREDWVQEISSSNVLALKRFVTLERRLLSQYPYYAPNFDSEGSRRLSGKSSFTREMGISLFIASNGERDVARCAALINPKYQAAKDEKVGFIAYFAAAEGCESYLCHRYEELGLNKAYGYTINKGNLSSRKMNEAIGGTARVLYHVYDKII